MSSNLNYLKGTLYITWDLNENGERINPRPTPSEISIAGLQFRYSASTFGSQYPYTLCLELVDDVVENFDHHWRIVVGWRLNTDHASIIYGTFTESVRRATYYCITLAHNSVAEEWTLFDFEAHPFRKNFDDEVRAADYANDFRIDLIKDNGRVWVNRELLAVNSAYFRERLQELTKSESLKIDELETKAFLDYVYCIHPPTLKLTLARVRRIIPMAKRFENRELISRCENFLKTFVSQDPKQTREHLLEVGRQGLHDAFGKALYRMKRSDLKGMDAAVIAQFTPANLRLFLERLLTPERSFLSRFMFLIRRTCTQENFTSSKGLDKSELADFFDGSKPYDCTILVAGHESTPIFVKKSLLAMHSEYFKKLFFGDFKEANTDTVTLKDIDFEMFLEYLASVHTPSPPLTMARVGKVLSMADQFRNELLLKHCSDFLQFKMDKTSAEKLQTLYLADQSDLKTLFASTLEQLNEDVENVNIEIVIGFRPENLHKFIDYCLKRL